MIVDTTKGKDLFGTGSSWDASTRVGEYGGGAATAYGGFVYFSNFGDFRVYKLDAANGGEPVAVTPGNFSTSSSAVRSSDDETPVLTGIYREQRPPIRGFCCTADPSSPPRCDS